LWYILSLAGNENGEVIFFFVVVFGRWWIDAEGEEDRVEGVLYTVCSNFDYESEILIRLKKEDDREKIKNLERFPSHRYALIPEELWLRSLKR